MCGPHSAESQLARARDIGLVTGLLACIPRAHRIRAPGPGRLPHGRAAEGGRALTRGRPTHRPEAPPRRRPRAAPAARKASLQERVLWGWRRVRTPAPAACTEKGQRTPAARRMDGRLGEGERPTPDAPHLGKKRPPPGAPVLPPGRAKPARKSACCEVGDWSPGPQLFIFGNE